MASITIPNWYGTSPPPIWSEYARCCRPEQSVGPSLAISSHTPCHGAVVTRSIRCLLLRPTGPRRTVGVPSRMVQVQPGNSLGDGNRRYVVIGQGSVRSDAIGAPVYRPGALSV